MAAKFELNASARTSHGTSAARRMRREQDQVPAVIYGGNEQAESITLNHADVITASSYEAFYSHILTINVDKKPQKVIIKDIARHPFKNKVLHMDFLRIKADEKLTMHVPLHFMNEDKAPGVKAGGSVTHYVTDVEISCLPEHLPEFIEVDLGQLELDQSIHLSELVLPEGVEIPALAAKDDHDHDSLVASIHVAKVAEASEEEAAETTEEAPSETEAAEEAASDESAKDNSKE